MFDYKFVLEIIRKGGTKLAYSYCTLFDKNYLDRGMVLLESIRNYSMDFRIYILPMDDMCYEVLQALQIPNVILIKMAEFETQELLEVKKTRSRGEYCWTCTASLIYFVLTMYEEEYCTYLDADMCFYDDPDQLVDEMIQSGKSVQIIEHRFRNGFAGKMQEELSGRFCVEFNTFRNDENGKKVLDDWRRQTIEKCAFSGDGRHFGDQMYLEYWMEKYDCINILQNAGAGLAPWNINRYSLSKDKDGEIWVTCDEGKEPVRIVFFHYHDLRYITKKKVNINVHRRYWKLNMELTYLLYKDYIKRLDEKREWIKREYEFCPAIPTDAVVTETLSIQKRIKRLFAGNVFKNIRFRLGNYLKIFLFKRYDVMDIA